MRRAKRTSSGDRAAFTLLEILLTLALIVAAATMLWPTLNRSMNQLRLRKASDQVRSALAETRLRALNTGQTQVFSYVAGQNTFKIGCLNGEDQSATPPPIASGDSNSPAPAGGAGGNLPEGIILLEGNVAQDQSRRSNQEVSAADRASGNEARVFFYPDGSGSTARIIVGNKDERYVAVDLRGLTGLSLASDILTSAELK